MRWSIRRPQQATASVAVLDAPAAALSTAGDGPVFEAPPPSRREWAGLDPLQPVVSAPPLVVPGPEFYEHVHGARSLVHKPPMLAMDPHPDLTAPVGYIVALSAPQVIADGPELTPAPPPRASHSGPAPSSTEAWDPWGGRQPEPVGYEPPVQHLEEVEPAPPPPLVASSPFLTSDLVLPPRALVPDGRPDDAPFTAPSPPAVTEAPAVNDGPPIPLVSPRADREPVPGARPEDPDDDLYGRPAPPPLRPSVGRTRRSGLGAPVLIHPAAPPPDDGVPVAAPGMLAEPGPAADVPSAVTEIPAPAPEAVVPREIDIQAPPPPERDLPVVPRRRARLGAPIQQASPVALPPPLRPEPIPPPVRAAVQRQTGVDPGEVLVHRDDRAGREAAELRARAFARDGEVSLPIHHGPLTETSSQALLAHELTHVVQQRQYGSSLPMEHTPLGRRLERDARRAEREVSGTLEPTPPPVAEPPAPPPAAQAATDITVTPPVGDFVVGGATDAYRQAAAELEAAGAELGEDGTVWLMPERRPAQSAGVQRAEVDEEPIHTQHFIPTPPPPPVTGDIATAVPLEPGAPPPLPPRPDASLVSEFLPPPAPRAEDRGIAAPVDHEQRATAFDPEQQQQRTSTTGLRLLDEAAYALPSLIHPAAPVRDEPEYSSSGMITTGTVEEPPAAPEPPAGPQQSVQPIDTDALFHEFYKRMRTRLKRDMLIERERSGAVTNSH